MRGEGGEKLNFCFLNFFNFSLSTLFNKTEFSV